MSTRALRLEVALGAVVFALLAALAPAAIASPASAADGSASCELAEPTDDDVISILGRICDRRESPQAPVEGVTFTVEDDAGEVVGEAISGPDGTFVIDLPGAAIDNLGKEFIVKLDTDTLPEDTEPEVLTRTVSVNLDNGPVRDVPDRGGGPRRHGLRHRGAPADHRRASSSPSLLAMAALGLSMIFGTTGLTNFAHGELITFGALVAFAVDQLPGAIEIGGANVTVMIGVVAAFVVGGAFGWLNDAALWKPLRRRGTGLVAMMIVSIGLSIFLRNIFQYFAGAQSQQLLPVLRGPALGDRTDPAHTERAGGDSGRRRGPGRHHQPAPVHATREGHPRGGRQPWRSPPPPASTSSG